ncbi:MAG TPA: universal stress protein, partial [Longimicrobiaceae bacterium]|nr:universal stress protein [Longimicrobiaceae bacterium]
VARTPMALPLTRVLLTTDLSEFSATVHDTALDTIDLFFRAPRFVRSLLVLGWSAVAPPLTPAQLTRAAGEALDRFLGDRGVAGPPVEPTVRSGITADEIVSEAKEWRADLLVLGTHARAWGARLMLGSVAEAVLRDAPCNVLAVPPMPVAAGAAPAVSANESADLHRWLEATV